MGRLKNEPGWRRVDALPMTLAILYDFGNFSKLLKAF